MEVGRQARQVPLPPGVIGQPQHVKGDALRLQIVQEPAAGGIVAPRIQVDHNLYVICGGEAVFDAGNPRLQQGGQMRPVVGISCPDTAVFPEHAGGDFIADLHDMRQGILRFEGGDEIGGVVVNGRLQGGEVEVGPGGRFALVPWVGPGIGVMDVQQQPHPGSMDAPRQRQGCGRIVEAVRVIDPHAEARAVDAVGGEEGQRILGDATGSELRAGRFHLGQIGDVHAAPALRQAQGPGGGGNGRGDGRGRGYEGRRNGRRRGWPTTEQEEEKRDGHHSGQARQRLHARMIADGAAVNLSGGDEMGFSFVMGGGSHLVVYEVGREGKGICPARRGRMFSAWRKNDNTQMTRHDRAERYLWLANGRQWLYDGRDRSLETFHERCLTPSATS